MSDLESQNKLSIALIARDKYSHSIESLTSILNSVDKSSTIYIFDSGYPKSIKDEILRITYLSENNVVIVPIGIYANTNVVWNLFIESVKETEYVMCVENDVVVGINCISEIIDFLDQKRFDIAVPIVYEDVFSNIHFNPVVSEITRRSDGKIESFLDRGRTIDSNIVGSRRVSHLERHCFAMSYDTALRLGKLDEEMWDRTDYDMSITCFVNDISIGIPERGYVIFKPDASLNIDHGFMDNRWNIGKVRRANERLIRKWNLHGFKTTIDHAYAIRKMLDQDMTSLDESSERENKNA